MDTPNYAAITYELELLCGLLHKVARQELVQRLERSGVDLRPGQYLILRALRPHPLTLAELSRFLLLDPSTLLPTVDQLERRGVLKRIPDPTDRRRIPLVLTDEGQALLASIPKLAEDSPLAQQLRHLGTDKCQQLAHLLAEVVLPFAADHTLFAASAALRALLHEEVE
ncbi:MarR family winged helix-turn-helix transcriptional regulator [Ktedonosporobacter rubrisoli]|uniref:MarR family winged helix-turn-helix transcriptional regulator n=1 Tax=Ktedonosporobacter rubrisoli TaxID=2509675 RepID=UPI0013EE9049|nr:MarR family transcriptional regulator [Ktedonosporobacter rubrisoli]